MTPTPHGASAADPDTTAVAQAAAVVLLTMAAYFAGTTQAPLTAAVIVCAVRRMP